jgi:lipoprotein signal peptidase
MGGRSYHWPTFNIADSCICVGAAVLAWRMLRGKI